MVPARRRLNADLLTIAAPALLAAVLCAYELGTRSLWLDEGATIAIASQHGAALWHGIAHDGGNMLAYYLLLHVLVGIFGDGTALIRLPSVIADAASAALVAALALRLFADRRIALSAGLLTAVSLPLVFWGQDARGYALMVALTAGAYLAFVAILQTPAGERVSPGTVVAYAALTLAALYVGFDAALLIPAQLAMLVVFRERARVVIGALVVVALLSVPLLVLGLERGSGQLFWVPPLSFSVLGQSAVTLTSAGLPPNFHETATTAVTAALSGLLLIATMWVAITAIRRDGPRESWPLALLATWVLVPTALALAALAAGEPVELSRLTILVMPALSLLIGWALVRPELPRWAGWTALAVLLGLRVAQLVPSYGTSPENWKAAARYVVAATAGRPACVAFYPEDGRMPFDYYVRQAPAATVASLSPVLPAVPWRTIRPYVERYDTLDAGRRPAIARRCAQVWLLVSHQGQKQGPAQARRNYAGYRRLLSELGRQYPSVRQRKFGWAAVVRVYRFQR